MAKHKKKVEEHKKKSGRHYIITAIISIFVIWIVKGFWPQFIPLDVWGMWEIKGNLGTWIKYAWPIFAWGIGVNMFFTFLRGSDRWDFGGFRYTKIGGTQVWIVGTLVSLWAGITEEICFRWLIFLEATATIRLGNFLIFGWLGLGIAEWFHMYVWGPLTNWMTLGYLQEWIFHESGWAVGAAMLWANAFFRDGHKYQGIFGMTNSWFIGMFFFWMTFNYGLLAAIIVHFLYDFLIFTYAAVVVGVNDMINQNRKKRYGY